MFSVDTRVFRRACAAVMIAALAASAAAAQHALGVVRSPDETIAVRIYLNDDGAPRYTVDRAGERVLEESALGLIADDGNFSTRLQPAAQATFSAIEDRYELLTSKRRLNTYRANRGVFPLKNASGATIDLEVQVSDDGLGLRYRFPEKNSDVRRLGEERTSFRFPAGARAWLQPMSVAKTGWSQTNPSYEEYYLKDIPVGTPSPLGAGWIYPALFRTGDTWIVITETGLGPDYCGTRLRSESPGGEYTIGFPDPREGFPGGPVNPESSLPWTTPWRVVVVGDLATVTESTLGTDLADKPAKTLARFDAQPGHASWSWPLLGDPNTNYEVQKQFIDYAAGMGWRYCLIDALWDKQIGYEKTKELIDYAAGKHVKILLWYNSAGDWNEAPQTPRDVLLTRESRQKEFSRLQAMGVAGLKIDFFGGDGQSMIAYYHDILRESAEYGLVLNFHGATLPRGWQRTYPHLMTVEAVRGLEFITFEQKNADQAPSHIAMLPFTRNLFDPMDFTPVVLDRINKIERRTTSACELAQAVLFTSGIQHYAEIPDGMAKAPEYVRAFLRELPEIWDDVRFLDGEPGKLAVFARRAGERWYIAGVNGEPQEKTITFTLERLGLPAGAKLTLITDGAGGNLSFEQQALTLGNNPTVEVTLKPYGGFVLTTP